MAFQIGQISRPTDQRYRQNRMEYFRPSSQKTVILDVLNPVFIRILKGIQMRMLPKEIVNEEKNLPIRAINLDVGTSTWSVWNLLHHAEWTSVDGSRTDNRNMKILLNIILIFASLFI
mgnify:CR=1 FL=1